MGFEKAVSVYPLVFMLYVCPSLVTVCWCACNHPEEEKPVVTNVTVSDVSWDSFLLSWSAEDGAFQAFLIEVTDAETGAEWHNHTVPAHARSLTISGLSPATWYRASLYGLYRGAVLDPVFADTITGIKAVNVGASLFPSLPSSSAEHSELTSVFICVDLHMVFVFSKSSGAAFQHCYIDPVRCYRSSCLCFLLCCKTWIITVNSP